METGGDGGLGVAGLAASGEGGSMSAMPSADGLFGYEYLVYLSNPAHRLGQPRRH